MQQYPTLEEKKNANAMPQQLIFQRTNRKWQNNRARLCRDYHIANAARFVSLISINKIDYYTNIQQMFVGYHILEILHISLIILLLSDKYYNTLLNIDV